MENITIPTLLFWMNGNTWYGSSGAFRFYIQPVKEEEPHFQVDTWRGPLSRELSQRLEEASFPLDEAGLETMTAWLEERAAALNREA